MRKVKRNKRILELCYVQLGLFLFLLVGVLLYFGKVFQVQEKAGLTLRMLLVTVALVGCSVSLALKDYIKGVIQSAAIDVEESTIKNRWKRSWRRFRSRTIRLMWGS